MIRVIIVFKRTEQKGKTKGEKKENKIALNLSQYTSLFLYSRCEHRHVLYRRKHVEQFRTYS